MVTDKKDYSKNWLENLVTTIAAILVICTFGFLIFQLIYQKPSPPDLVVTLGDVVLKEEGFSVPLVVKNQGTQTAKNISIEIISGEGDSEEKGEINFDFLPGGSSVRGWVNFSMQSAPTSLKPHVLGYSTP